ncbi:MAG: bifunctional GTP diphosphokinase/guanosine-3',5'-bis pyrophosphate 3'-pyrophosphohydrolase [Gammaproteobacteria bacterium]|nr:bifunctional GTP diphosphokinase/guanosine-3',5'-bis pyrophosphate 3'-pyrophosphohydrolase [Gammaproteobacteria bacterium]MCF6230366.1 bifunctional GTP diphosphokinase/guanosine-3',5'-bis pyrophosphate 3'-pyrophosphohydrolase [Gammaproteobacteria bacterium]
MSSISTLCQQLEEYLEPYQITEVYRAYVFSAESHEGQYRKSGEPYITHPLAVATILAEMRMDYRSLMAAILHDVIEDTGVDKAQLETEFGNEVAELVDGVSKLTHIHFESKVEAQAANFRKMILAMVKDIRVILIKLADRLHNMSTLGVMRPDKCRRIARETLEIYVPIASRLGMNQLRLNLEDLGFLAYYPNRYKVLKKAVLNARGNRKEILQRIETAIKERLDQEGIPCQVFGREKHIYSLYQKMKRNHLNFSEVMDVYAFRIVVDSVDSCYRILGTMHNLYKPVPGKFKDYIAISKTNGYQSLHTILFGPFGVPIEIQIRTTSMDEVAEAGIAAHWLYKSDASESGSQVRAQEWLRELLDIQNSVGDSLEFLENVKIDLFPDEVYVFTPKGEIMELPRRATTVDFAYAVHTAVGDRCVAAKIDRKLVPLSTRLQNGQTVEIITTKNSHPNPVWLDFAVTGKARTSIRSALKNLQYDEALALGKRLLNKTLGAFSSSIEQVSEQSVQRYLEEQACQSLDDLLVDIGLGQRVALITARQLIADQQPEGDTNGLTRPLAIRGTEGMVVTFAKCCHPIPGDPICGHISIGRGIVIHTESCNNTAEFRNRPEQSLDVQWDSSVEGEFAVSIRVDALNRRGVMATVASAIASQESNIEKVYTAEHDGTHHSTLYTITVRSRIHLAAIIRKLRALPNVAKITRTRG